MAENIRDRDKFFMTHWDWSFLNWSFPGTTIQVGDIDGYVEQRGQHLFIETKLPGVAIPERQEINFLNLQDAGNNTILVIWGQDNEAECVRLYTAQGVILEGEANNIDVALLVRGWFLWTQTLPFDRKFYDVPVPPEKIKPIRRLLNDLFERIKDG